MPLDVIDPDESVRTTLSKELGDRIPDAILVSADAGFEALEAALESGRIVIAYGIEPHGLGDPRYLDAFRLYNYVYVHAPVDAGRFSDAYRWIAKRREASTFLPSIPKSPRVSARRKR
jgi:hypothetical protein